MLWSHQADIDNPDLSLNVQHPVLVLYEVAGNNLTPAR